MGPELFQNLQIIPLERIDPLDRLFAISLWWLPLDRLTDSIAQVGLLSPIHLQKTAQDRFRIVIGFRRYQAARDLGMERLTCLIEDEGDHLKLFRKELEDNLSSRPLHLLEKARVLSKLSRDFKVSDQVLLDEYMPLLGIRPDRFNLHHQFDLAALPESLQQSVTDLLDPEIALGIRGWKGQEQDFFVALVSKFRLGRNKQRQLFDLLDEIRASETRNRLLSPDHPDQHSVQLIWEKSGAANKEADQHLPLAERFQQAVEKLVQLRFPLLSRHQQRCAELKAALKLPPEIQLRVPPHFEGNQVNLSLSAGNPQELLRLARRLEKTAQKDELKEIFNLL